MNKVRDLEKDLETVRGVYMQHDFGHLAPPSYLWDACEIAEHALKRALDAELKLAMDRGMNSIYEKDIGELTTRVVELEEALRLFIETYWNEGLNNKTYVIIPTPNYKIAKEILEKGDNYGESNK